MDTATIVAALDEEIATLHKVRTLLSSDKAGTSTVSLTLGADRPKRKRALSMEARAKIAAAQKKRWAKQKGAHRVAEK